MGFYADRGTSFADAKAACGGEIESWYGSATLDTFDSNVLGAVWRYECSEAAQLRFLNGKTANLPIDLMCGPVLAPDADPVWRWMSHTAVECGKVHNGYLQFSKDAALQYSAYKTQLAATTTIAEVDAIMAVLWG